MFNLQALHISMLLWGCIFCLTVTVCIAMSKNFDTEKRKWLILMQGFTALLLGNDALAWMFRGYPGLAGTVMVHLSNFVVFAATDIVLFFFHAYICCYLFTKDEMKQIRRIKVGFIFCILATALVIISQFSTLYYYFDANNFYHRGDLYWVSMLLPLLCMLTDLSLLIEYRKRLSIRLLAALTSYILLPVLASIFQLFHYGLSLINLAISISMIFIYIATIQEQNKQIERLAQSRAATLAALEISTTLNNCVRELSANIDINLAIQNLLKNIADYFCADRAYIFELSSSRDTLINTFEYTLDGVTAQIDNLQAVPLEVISNWMEAFMKNEVYYISDVEHEKMFPTYEMLKEQDIQRLLAVPLWENDEIIGFLGVDNPSEHCEDNTLLSSIQFFVANSLSSKKQQETLRYMSYRDMLTQLYNRNKYIDDITLYEHQQIDNIGIVYLDLNGLKKINDTQGHEAGDEFICRAATVLKQVFDNHAYRIGGDEFVVLYPDIESSDFQQKIRELQELMSQHRVSVSIGSLWNEKTTDFDQMLKEADRLMYQEKELYHKKNS